MLNLKFKLNLHKFQKRLSQNHLLDWAEKLLAEFPAGEIYLVGGAVRDALLGRPDQRDYDFVVGNIRADELEKFLSGLGTVNLVGKHFGVFKFRPACVPKDRDFGVAMPDIDIALPRTEHSVNLSGGYKDFDVQSDPALPIEIDLSRRDFTINAMALRLSAKNFQLSTFNFQLIDCFDGINDLKKKIIRTVGQPEDRFQEDYTRLLRAVRFACQLGFKIEPKTWRAVKESIVRLNDKIIINDDQVERVIPYESISKELLKSFYYNPVRALDLWDQSGALEELMPELLPMKGCPQPPNWHSEGDVWTHTILALENLNSDEFKKQFISEITTSPGPSLLRRGAVPSSSSPCQGEGGAGSKSDEKDRIELIMSVLFHDIGKPYTIKTPEKDGADRIRFNGHDAVGGDLSGQICRRLKMSSPEKYGVDADRVSWLVKNHMIFMHGEADEMKNSTMEKYFFSRCFSSANLLKLGFADAISTIPEGGKPDLTNFHKILERMEKLKNLSAEKTRLPPPLLNGKEIMEELDVPAGPKIGELLELLREEQLSQGVKTKTEAVEFLKKY